MNENSCQVYLTELKSNFDKLNNEFDEFIKLQTIFNSLCVEKIQNWAVSENQNVTPNKKPNKIKTTEVTETHEVECENSTKSSSTQSTSAQQNAFIAAQLDNNFHESFCHNLKLVNNNPSASCSGKTPKVRVPESIEKNCHISLFLERDKDSGKLWLTIVQTNPQPPLCMDVQVQLPPHSRCRTVNNILISKKSVRLLPLKNKAIRQFLENSAKLKIAFRQGNSPENPNGVDPPASPATPCEILLDLNFQETFQLRLRKICFSTVTSQQMPRVYLPQSVAGSCFPITLGLKKAPSDEATLFVMQTVESPPLKLMMSALLPPNYAVATNYDMKCVHFSHQKQIPLATLTQDVIEMFLKFQMPLRLTVGKRMPTGKGLVESERASLSSNVSSTPKYTFTPDPSSLQIFSNLIEIELDAHFTNCFQSYLTNICAGVCKSVQLPKVLLPSSLAPDYGITMGFESCENTLCPVTLFVQQTHEEAPLTFAICILLPPHYEVDQQPPIRTITLSERARVPLAGLTGLNITYVLQHELPIRLKVGPAVVCKHAHSSTNLSISKSSSLSIDLCKESETALNLSVPNAVVSGCIDVHLSDDFHNYFRQALIGAFYFHTIPEIILLPSSIAANYSIALCLRRASLSLPLNLAVMHVHGMPTVSLQMTVFLPPLNEEMPLRSFCLGPSSVEDLASLSSETIEYFVNHKFPLKLKVASREIHSLFSPVQLEDASVNSSIISPEFDLPLDDNFHERLRSHLHCIAFSLTSVIALPSLLLPNAITPDASITLLLKKHILPSSVAIEMKLTNANASPLSLCVNCQLPPDYVPNKMHIVHLAGQDRAPTGIILSPVVIQCIQSMQKIIVTVKKA